MKILIPTGQFSFGLMKNLTSLTRQELAILEKNVDITPR